MLYIGLMSGTSMDAVDVAIVEFNPGACVKHYKQYPLKEELKQRIRPLNDSSRLMEVTEMDFTLGHIFADAVNQLLKETGISTKEITAIGNHGQTVFHHPDGTWQTSIQLGDPNIICTRTGITTIADFRRMDMALGGQGAPLAPAFHRFQFQQTGTNRTILNIGGIANITHLPADSSKHQVLGFDTGPGNGLLDDWVFKHRQTRMDEDSAWAKSGTLIPELLHQLRSDPYFSQLPPKSTGREYFNLDWLEKHLAQTSEMSAGDTQATLFELSMSTIADAILDSFPECNEVYVCGGGAKNPAMMARLDELFPGQRVARTDELGINSDAVEAATFAWLAYCRVNELAIDFSSITGSQGCILPGGIYKPASQ